MEKYGSAEQAKDGIACWIPKTTNTHSQYVTLLFHINNGCTNGTQCYLIRTLSVLQLLRVIILRGLRRGSAAAR